MGTFANSEDPDDNVAFHQALFVKVKQIFRQKMVQGCKIIFLVTRPAGQVGGKSYSPSWHYHLPLITDHTCFLS